MPLQKPRQREKKVVNEPMEVKQHGPARYGREQADASYASRIAQQRGKTRTTQQKVKDFYNSSAGQAVKNAYDRAFNTKPKAKAAYDDGNGTTFLNAKPQKQIKDQQNNPNVYGRVTAVNGKPVKKKERPVTAMNWETILVAVIAALGPLLGTILTIKQQNRLIDYRMGQVESSIKSLSAKVDKHNSFDRRLIVIETKLGIETPKEKAS